MEPADWIGVGLVVLGLVLVASAFFVRKSRTGNSGIEGNLHPSIAKDLAHDDGVEVGTAGDAQELEQPVPGANAPQA